MAKNKDPAVLFYTSDFLSGCALMDMRERGQYITLLCLQRERGHMTMQEITRAVKKPSDEVMSKFRQDEEGKYYNHRMEQEIEKRDAHCQRQRAEGKYFVILRANFSKCFYCPFRKKTL